MSAILAGYFPNLPPTPKPVGGPVPDRSMKVTPGAFHCGGVEAKRERRRHDREWIEERRAGK
jgi:hypothetical protein